MYPSIGKDSPKLANRHKLFPTAGDSHSGSWANGGVGITVPVSF